MHLTAAGHVEADTLLPAPPAAGLGTPTCSSVTDLPLAANGPASDGGAPPQQQQQPERGGSRGSLTHFYSEPVPNNAAAGASGATSPVNMSREGSLAAPSLATVSTGMTPTAGKQKTKGRFQVGCGACRCRLLSGHVMKA